MKIKFNFGIFYFIHLISNLELSPDTNEAYVVEEIFSNDIEPMLENDTEYINIYMSVQEDNVNKDNLKRI